jgi:dTDP-4-dehydrorhamnose 3,5-epimerase
MKVSKTKLSGLFILEPNVAEDHRGFFMESFNRKKFAEHGLNFDFVQDNHSLSVRPETIRGLHYQLQEKAQTKRVRVISGAVYDVAVDIRQHSPTFGQWVGVTLSATNRKQLLVPKGFAHGFCTMVPDTEVLYKVDEYYSYEHDRGIAWNDPAIGISWPCLTPILSDKDAKHPWMADAENNFI